ncbi:hypothetical protein CDAR_503141 [Caerostris darwini]|uniref:Uncharacterized protein n=1 Tax=Caerostris darwini TaxID=1538125 RepID=A0AAV4VM68_9ARAC|nr:hypothetical protein CDAR_503141 [Caerostris darwini]
MPWLAEANLGYCFYKNLSKATDSNGSSQIQCPVFYKGVCLDFDSEVCEKFLSLQNQARVIEKKKQFLTPSTALLSSRKWRNDSKLSPTYLNEMQKIIIRYQKDLAAIEKKKRNAVGVCPLTNR